MILGSSPMVQITYTIIDWHRSVSLIKSRKWVFLISCTWFCTITGKKKEKKEIHVKFINITAYAVPNTHCNKITGRSNSPSSPSMARCHKLELMKPFAKSWIKQYVIENRKSIDIILVVCDTLKQSYKVQNSF